MKILHLLSSVKGGAANSAVRLHLGLLGSGIDSKILTLDPGDGSIPGCHRYFPSYLEPAAAPLGTRIRAKTDRLAREFGIHAFTPPQALSHNDYLLNRPAGLEMFSNPLSGLDIVSHPLCREADLINLHWVAGFLDYTDFFSRIGKPVVWTLHDMNAFTGGCHYHQACPGFTDSCQLCPQLDGTIDPAYSSRLFDIKKEALSRFRNLTIVTPSAWLGKQSESSLLFSGRPHFLIPYGLDTDHFQPRERSYSAKLLGLPEGKKVLLFVADSVHNSRKGYRILLEAIRELPGSRDFIIAAIGKTEAGAKPDGVFELGRIDNELMMSVAYSAADLFVIPSLEDNLPNTVLESLCCGTPVAGFRIGGIPDMVSDGVNGLLCGKTDATSLAATITRCFHELSFNREEISRDARKKYTLKRQAEAYVELYKNLIG
ncbi:MAG: glycosyltransferase [Bacteroidota bacterium]